MSSDPDFVDDPNNTQDHGADYRRIREQLRYWPYTINQIEDTLDIGLIEGKGRQLLFQAINARNLTAFVGSGVSAAYGRLSWSRWQDEQFSVVQDGVKHFEELKDASEKLLQALIFVTSPETPEDLPTELALAHTEFSKQTQPIKYNLWRWLRFRLRQVEDAWHRIEGLRATFQRSKSDGGFPGGEELPLKFQIAQQLHDQMRSHINIFMPPAHINGELDEVLKNGWPGARIDDDSSPPRSSLKILKSVLSTGSFPQIEAFRETYNEKLHNFFDIFSREQSRVSAETFAKVLLFDERAHAMLTLAEGLESEEERDLDRAAQKREIRRLEKALGIYRTDVLVRGIKGIREDQEMHRVLSAFEFETLSELKRHLTPQRSKIWKEFIDWEEKRIEQTFERIQRAGDKRPFITPSFRFLVAVYLRLLDRPFDLIQMDENDKISETSPLLPQIEREDFKSRRSILADRFDPLAKTVWQLGITRYVTTNYDLEIERFFQDMGYRKFPKIKDKTLPVGLERAPLDDEYRSDPIGGRLLDQTFDRDRASDLVAFSVEDQRKDAAVFHLHGRATEGDKLIITERDYMNLYLLEDHRRDTVNEAITMAFSSAPLVFLGLGMEEADLLRPLRQFMSNRDRTIGYHAVAILPGEKPIEQRTKFSVTCFLRYGVHTIFYGSGRIRCFFPERENEERHLSIDWLCRILLLCRAVGDEVRDLRKTGHTRSSIDVFVDLARKVGFTNDGLSDKSPNFVALAALFKNQVEVEHGATPDTITAEILKDVFADVQSGQRELHVCEFTPIRPDKEAWESRHFDKDVFVKGDDYVGFATGLLNKCLLILLDIHKTASPSKDMTRDLAALEIALNGIYGACLNGALNAQLVALEREWRSWWNNWQQSPPHRVARFAYLPFTAKRTQAFQPARLVRHRVTSIITDTSVLENKICSVNPVRPPTKSEKAANPNIKTTLDKSMRTGVRAFDTFIHAIHDGILRKQPHALRPDRRLLLTVAAYRGLGKGSFLSAMSSNLGLSLYEQVTWAQLQPRPNEGQPFIMAALFINLSFSTEIASCFDCLRQALLEMVAALEATKEDLDRAVDPFVVRQRLQASINSKVEGIPRPYHYANVGTPAHAHFLRMERLFLGVSRKKTISELFNRFAELSSTLGTRHEFGRARMMIYLSGLELIYDEKSRPKNAEIRGLVDLIFAKESSFIPVDFVFVASEGKLGYPFSTEFGDGRHFFQSEFFSENLTPRAAEQIAERKQNGKLSLDSEAEIAQHLAGLSRTTSDPSNLVPDICTNFVHFARPVSPVSLLNDNFQTLSLGLYINNPPTVPADRIHNAEAAKETLEELKEAYRQSVIEGRESSDEDMDDYWAGQELPDTGQLDLARKIVWENVQRNCESLAQRHARLINPKHRQTDTLEDILRQRLSMDNSDDREEWRRIRRRVGNNRFITTLLLAAMDFIVVHDKDPVNGARQAETFIRHTIDQVRNAGQERREDLILEIVLDRYRRYKRIGVADLDVELHELILRHLGLIGAPTSPAVLVRLPEFRDYFLRVGIELPYSRRRFLTRALTVLAYRGLIFRLDPHPQLVNLAGKRSQSGKGEEESYWPADQAFRYALHRTVQTYAIAKMGVGKIDPVRNNSFAPRLYVSMPSIGTGLSFESYQFVRSLLIGLSQYPDINRTDTDLVPWLFNSNAQSVRVQALRAALSTARSTVSVATLSRFPAHADRDDALRSQMSGLLENYKVRLRWIIRMAWEMVHKDDQERAEKNAPSSEFEYIQPLYRDEIVWIYNELGVIALSQGNLTEALGFLRQAAEFNEEIEGRSRFGPIFDYIDLNHAIVQLERGRLESALRRLNRICERYQDEPGSAMFNFAEGYLCVIAHVRGTHEGLDTRFQNVVRNLQALGDTRAVAIFMSHQARFLASRPNSKVLSDLEVARGLAETGGHEDIRHHIEISRVTVQFRTRKDKERKMVNSEALKQLRDIETYGQRMGIWNLQVDALKLRAQILLEEGETSTAGSLLVRSMAIAKRFRMTLRLIASLNIYADLLFERGDLAGAERHALIALEMAKEVGYSLQTSLAQRTLAKIDPDKY